MDFDKFEVSIRLKTELRVLHANLSGFNIILKDCKKENSSKIGHFKKLTKVEILLGRTMFKIEELNRIKFNTALESLKESKISHLTDLILKIREVNVRIKGLSDSMARQIVEDLPVFSGEVTKISKRLDTIKKIITK